MTVAGSNVLHGARSYFPFRFLLTIIGSTATCQRQSLNSVLAFTELCGYIVYNTILTSRMIVGSTATCQRQSLNSVLAFIELCGYSVYYTMHSDKPHDSRLYCDMSATVTEFSISIYRTLWLQCILY